MSQKAVEKKEGLIDMAGKSGLAIALVDSGSTQVEEFNNNSMCRVLNPGKGFSAACGEYCGKAYQEVYRSGGEYEFECYAGLNCKAVAFSRGGRQLVAITGRAFVKAENYRRATERAISGDWSRFPPTEFFENILITGSPENIMRLAQSVAGVSEGPSTDILELDPTASTPASPSPWVADDAPQPEPSEISRLIERFHLRADRPVRSPESAPNAAIESDVHGETADLRSLSGSLMKADYAEACRKLLDFVADRYGFDSRVWFEIRNGEFRTGLARGPIGEKTIEVGVPADHPLLSGAAKKQLPFVLRERARSDGAPRRTLNLFPLTVGGEIRFALGIEGEMAGEARVRRIARIAQSIASQLEILRLREEVMQRDWLARAVRVFNESLKKMDAEDFWQRVTQVSAELLGAERASLLVKNEKSNRLQAKASVGSIVDLLSQQSIGNRVSRPALDSGKPAIVLDAAESANPAPEDWNYKTASYLTYPVSIGERNIAVLNFTDKADGSVFTERDLELLQAIAPQIAMAIDRASLKDKAGEFEQLSVTDALTALLNRRYLQERMSEEIQRSRRHRFPLSLLMLDVDSFKSYNDSYGHLAGDAALRIVANILKDNLRGDDVAARYGGEEFAVLLPQTRIDEASVIAERIRNQIERTEFPHRSITASIGIASSSESMSLPDDLIWAADRALYEAKGNGRNKVQLYDDFGDPHAEKVH